MSRSGVKAEERPPLALPDGRRTRVFEIRNASGAGLTVMELGATLLTVEIPDRDGHLADVAPGFDDPADYLASSSYAGAVAGRYANRIATGRFTLDGRTHELARNDGAHTLHGGPDGFHRRLWRAKIVQTDDGPGVRFTLQSPDDDQGFPGRLDASVTYSFSEDNALGVAFEARTDAATIVSLCQHAYFNLGGHDAGSVLDHALRIAASAYTPVNEALIPTGEIAPVAGTPFDFRTPKSLGRDIGADHPQLVHGGGYDHNWALDGTGFREVAELIDPASGRRMTVLTDRPGLQVYSGNFLSGEPAGKGGAVYGPRCAVALEAQHFPDAPNQPGFPSPRLDPGAVDATRTIYRFSTL